MVMIASIQLILMCESSLELLPIFVKSNVDYVACDCKCGFE